ncbi:hypothetical protein [Micromonospora sp. L31]|uniref:hypothetical protein n=1 Tax=Micromonospora sp. L31 TaxID=3452213 RepID=UPI003F8C20CF
MSASMRRLAGRVVAVGVTATLAAAGSTFLAAGAAQAAGVRASVVNAAKAYLGTPYRLAYGWTCGRAAVDCECLNGY